MNAATTLLAPAPQCPVTDDALHSASVVLLLAIMIACVVAYSMKDAKK